MIITSWVDKYYVDRYQKSTIVLLNHLLIVKGLRLVHKNIPSNQNIRFKANVTGFPNNIDETQVVCPFVLFLLAIVLSVLLRYTDSDYPFGIFKLFFEIGKRKSVPNFMHIKPTT